MSAIQQAHEFSERPSMISQAGFHRWRNAQALVNLDKVVVHEMQGDRITVIIDFLAEPIRKAGEAPHVHSHGEILSLDVARAHILMLGIADNRLHLSTDAASGTVMPRFFFGRSAIEFMEGCIIHIHPEGAFYGLQVWFVRISRQLNTTSDASRNVLHKLASPRRIAFSDKIGNYQFGLGIDCNPRPNISKSEAALFRWHVLRLGITEAPNLIAFNATSAHVAHVIIVVALARRSEVAQQFLDRHSGNARNASRCPKAIAFDQCRDNPRPFFCSESIHTSHYTCTCKNVKGKAREEA